MPNPSPRRVRKAVLPAAGLGTRFLPATKAIPKEMLPVVDKPLIQYSVEECVASGIDHIIIVTGRGKSAIEDHFDSSPEMERFLIEKGKTELAAIIREIGKGVRFSYTRQHEALGLGHAVLTAKDLVGEEPFAVLLGDVIIQSQRPATRQLVEVYEATGQGAIAVEPVPMDQIHLYGAVKPAPADRKDAPASLTAGTLRLPAGVAERLIPIEDLVEKPKRDEAPSNLSVIGRYVLPPEIFDCLERTPPGRGGEIQLTDGMRLLAKEKGLWAYRYEGTCYDAGDKLGFLKANVEFGILDPELGPAFRAYLKALKF
ncbi:MAG TPA: UTP--glucose-1-phosphate uridylyltransferase GalU [Candidatus Acidoferrales bacterium]|nr:UTP--glucose-1-phosphate uridylyltransferase GalU [Candidatus Acidoferrales bacterium]